MAHIIRTTLDEEMERFNYGQEYEEVERSALTFVATDEFREKSAQAALANGTSVNALYIQLLSQGLGVLPCAVVAEEEQVLE